MGKFIRPAFLITATVVMLTRSTLSDGQTSPSEATLAAQIVAPQREIRQKAFEELNQSRTRTANVLLSNLTKLLKKPDKNWEGPLHLTLASIGTWRVEEAVPLLIPVIEFRLEGGFRPGATYLPQALYPVANTLVRIGGPQVNEGILNRLVLPANEEVLRASAWVLNESLGAEVAKFIVHQKLDRVTAVLKNIGVADTNPEKENLEKIEQLLKEEGPILMMPNLTPIASPPGTAPPGAAPGAK